MVNVSIAIFYPDREEEVGTYYDNIIGHLDGAIGAKYDVDSTTLGELQNPNWRKSS